MGAGWSGVVSPGSEIMSTHVTSNGAALPTPDDRETVEALRRKLSFLAWHRGTREADLLIGAFAARCLPEFAAEELRQFERLLEEDDPIIDDWIAGRQGVPKEHDNRVMALLRLFRLAISACPGRAISYSVFKGKAGSTSHH
jgi:antitoxin CptB